MFRRLLIFSLLITAVVLFSFYKTVYQAKQARFNVDVLDRFVRSYQQMTGQRIGSIADLPDFHLISRSEGLQLKGEDIKKGIYEGYVYDLSGVGTKDYVLSASPVGYMAPHMEFAALGDGNLYANKKNPDVDADTVEEVSGWERIMRVMSVQTGGTPDYLGWQ